MNSKQESVLYLNGNIYTVDARDSRAEAVLVKDGKIAFVGSNEDAKNTNKQKVDACRDATEKDIQLHVLKTRSGIITGNKHPLFFTYYAKYNHFEEADGDSYLSNFDDGNPQNKRKRI